MIRTRAIYRLKRRPPKMDELVILPVRFLADSLEELVKREKNWVWLPALAPTAVLLRAPRAEKKAWEAFCETYRQQLRCDPKARDLVKRLAKYAEDHDVLLCCYCADEERCHRGILKEEINHECTRMDTNDE